MTLHLFYFYRSNKIRFDVSCESSAEDSLEISSLIFFENNEKIFKTIVCCSCDRRFIKGLKSQLSSECFRACYHKTCDGNLCFETE